MYFRRLRFYDLNRYATAISTVMRCGKPKCIRHFVDCSVQSRGRPVRVRLCKETLSGHPEFETLMVGRKKVARSDNYFKFSGIETVQCTIN